MLENLKLKIKNCTQQDGIAAIFTVIVIGAVVALIVLALASSSLMEDAMSFGHLESQEAYTVAELGARDALQRLARDKDFATSSYSIVVGSGTADISVTKDLATTTIVSTGILNNKTKKIQVIINIGVCSGGSEDGKVCATHSDCAGAGSACAVGKIKQVSWEEI